jgi:hypothetical protein
VWFDAITPRTHRRCRAFLRAGQDRSMGSRLAFAFAVACAIAAMPAEAAVLYKSVDENGRVMFSDTPPSSEGARIVEQKVIDSSYASSPSSATGSAASGLEQAYGLIDSDVALAKANERVDLAEHALALARNGAMPRTEGLRLASSRNTAVDDERIEFYKRDLKLARRELVELLRSRQVASR